MPVGLILFLLFVATPLVEIYLLAQVARWISWPWTIAIVIGTGVAGASLARWQGFQVLRRVQDDLNHQRLPAQALVDGMMILVAAGLLLTPGLLTDAIGFSLLLPWCRTAYRRLFGFLFRRRLRGMFVDVTMVGSGRPNPEEPDDTVTSTFVDEDEPH